MNNELIVEGRSALAKLEVLDESASDLSFPDQVAILVSYMREMPQVDCPVVHRFAPGVYLREIFMPADTVVIGKVHKTKHFNILLQGACLIVHEDGTREEMHAPYTFISDENVQKVLYIIEDMIWQTVHVTEETNLEALEALLIAKEHPALTDRAREELARIAQERGGEV